MAEDDDQKTEQPTSKKLQEAIDKGNVPYSREITHFLLLAVLALIAGGFAPSILKNTQLLLTPFLADPEAMAVDEKGLGEILTHVLIGALTILAVPILCTFIAALFSRFAQSGLVISSEPLVPKLSKISPMAGMKRIFAMRSVVELVKNILKIIIVGVIGYLSISSELVHLRQLPESSILAMLLFLSKIASDMLIGILISVFFIALFDILYQRFQYYKSLRMTKQEIKDEYKQSEGDPKIKQRLRQLRMEKAQKRMMSQVPTADVVITNPTHFAVALKYESKTMKAPIVVAKGQDLIALKIREVAEENKIPVVENPPLARALFASTEIDQEIPTAHFEAVAKVISYVYQLKGKKV